MSKQKSTILFAAVCLMAGSLSMVTPASANAETPYYGKSYEQPASVQKLYPEPDETFDTPAFQKKEKHLPHKKSFKIFYVTLSVKVLTPRRNRLEHPLKAGPFQPSILQRIVTSLHCQKSQRSGFKHKYTEMNQPPVNLPLSSLND